MAEDVTKNTGDIENYSKEFIELQRQLAEIHREKFNGVDLFTSNAGGDGMNSEGSRFSYTLVTHDSGQVEDGSVSLKCCKSSDCSFAWRAGCQVPFCI